MHDKEIQWGYWSAKIEWKPDDWGDLSFYGSPTDKRDEYVVDRRKGQLLGAYATKVFSLPYEKIIGRGLEKYPYSRYGKSPTSDTWAIAEEILMAQYDACGISDESDGGPTVNWDEKTHIFTMGVSGLEILADNLGRTMGWHEYRYFRPENIDKEHPEYAVEDWKRWEDYNRGYWSYYVCIATIYKDGVEFASDSCGGIESDNDKEYIAEMERTVLGEALNRANIGIPAKELLERST